MFLKEYIKKAQYSYTYYVHFRNSFGSASREGLMHKLERREITGKFLKVVNAMYMSLSVSLMYKDKSTKSSPTTIGLEEGDVFQS